MIPMHEEGKQILLGVRLQYDLILPIYYLLYWSGTVSTMLRQLKRIRI
jgi:hypothetical protein